VAELMPIDYAHLGNNVEVELLLENKGLKVSAVNKPCIVTSVYCHDYFPTATVTTALVTGGVKSIPKLYKDREIFKPKIAYAVIGLGVLIDTALGIAKNIKKSLDSGIYKNYQNYHFIKENSLLGFQKYVAEHSGAYITLNAECLNNDKVVGYLKESYFKYPIYSEAEEVMFKLCDANDQELMGEL
jgi:hypothetical protein